MLLKTSFHFLTIWWYMSISLWNSIAGIVNFYAYTFWYKKHSIIYNKWCFLLHLSSQHHFYNVHNLHNILITVLTLMTTPFLLPILIICIWPFFFISLVRLQLLKIFSKVQDLMSLVFFSVYLFLFYWLVFLSFFLCTNPSFSFFLNNFKMEAWSFNFKLF